VLPKSTVTQHLALQSQSWHAAVLQSLAVILETHYDAGDDWETVETWTVDIKPWAWGAMLDGPHRARVRWSQLENRALGW
jgi:hypothetical protein